MRLRCGGIFNNISLRVYRWVWQWKNFENYQHLEKLWAIKYRFIFYETQCIQEGHTLQAVGGQPPRYASAPCKLTLPSYLFTRWHSFWHVGYLRHQQQVDLWPFDLESGVQVICNVGYLCANFGLPRPVLDLGPMYATYVRQTDVRQKHRLTPLPYAGGGIKIIRTTLAHCRSHC